jgi:hypothetical protein
VEGVEGVNPKVFTYGKLKLKKLGADPLHPLHLIEKKIE